MSKKALVPVNLIVSATAPTTPTPVSGDSWFDSDDNSLSIYNGTSWIKQNSNSYTTTATSATLVTLTVSSTRNQFFTGSTAQNVNLPVVSTLTLGDTFYVFNNSTAVVTVRSSGANSISAQAAGTLGIYTCILVTGTTAASWDFKYDGFSTVTGTGDNVLATSPTLVTPALGTPASGVMTSVTGLPLTTGTTGVLPETKGGTNQSTYATGDIVYASGTNTLAKRTVGSTGQVLTVAGGVPTWATPSSGGVSYYTQAYSATPLTLTSSSATNIRITGTGDQEIRLPLASTMALGQYFEISVESSSITASLFTASPTLAFVAAVYVQSAIRFTCILNSGTTAASWKISVVSFNQNSLSNPILDYFDSSSPNLGASLYQSVTTGNITLGSNLTTGSITIGGNPTGTLQLNGDVVGVSAFGALSGTKDIEIGGGSGLGATVNTFIGSNLGATENLNIHGGAIQLANQNIYIKPSGTAASGYVTTNASGLVSIASAPVPGVSYYSQAASATRLVLTSSSARNINISPTAGVTQEIQLPNASTMTLGDAFYITNESDIDSVGMYTADLIFYGDVFPTYILKFTCTTASGTTGASWLAEYNSGLMTSATGPTIFTINGSNNIGYDNELFNNDLVDSKIKIGGNLSGSVSDIFIGNYQLKQFHQSAIETYIGEAAVGTTKIISIGENNDTDPTNIVIGNTAGGATTTTIYGTTTIGSSTTKTTAYPVAPTGTTSGTITTSAQLSGYLGMPQNPKAATGTFSYTLLSSDAGKHIYYTGTPTSAALVIPANSAVAFEIGTTIVVMNDLGAATNVSISITTDTLQLAGTGTTGTRTLARYGVATITKVTATKWIISGNGLT